MSYGFLFGRNYGGVDNQYRPEPQPTQYRVRPVPNRGWVGDLVSISAEGLYTMERDRDFRSRSNHRVNTNWSLTSVVDGQASQTMSGLLLLAGPRAGSSVSLASTMPYRCSDSYIHFKVNKEYSGDESFATLDYFKFEARVNGYNYIKVMRSHYAALGGTYNCEIVSDGIMLAHGAIPALSPEGFVRIIYANGTAMVAAKDAKEKEWRLVAIARTFAHDFAAYISMSVANANSHSSRVGTTLYEFRSIPNVMYGTEIPLSARPTFHDIDTIVPPQPLNARFVDMTLFNYDGIVGTTQDGFEYVRTDKATLSSGPSGIVDLLGNVI